MRKRLSYLTAALTLTSGCLLLSPPHLPAFASDESQTAQTCSQVRERLQNVAGVWEGVSTGQDSDVCSLTQLDSTIDIRFGVNINGDLRAATGYSILKGPGGRSLSTSSMHWTSKQINTAVLPVAHNSQQIQALGNAMQEGDLAIMPVTITIKANNPDGSEISGFQPITFTAQRLVTKIAGKLYINYYGLTNKKDSSNLSEKEYDDSLMPAIYWQNQAGKVAYQGIPNPDGEYTSSDPRILKVSNTIAAYPVYFAHGFYQEGNTSFVGPLTIDEMANIDTPKISATFHATSISSGDLSELTLKTSNNADKPLELKEAEVADTLATNLASAKGLDGKPATLSSDDSIPGGSYSITIKASPVEDDNQPPASVTTSVEDGKLKIEGIEAGKTYTATYTLMRARLDNPAVTFAYPLTETVTFTVKKPAPPAPKPAVPVPSPVVPAPNPVAPTPGPDNGSANVNGKNTGSGQTENNGSPNKIIVKPKRHLASTGADASGLLLAAVFGVAGLALVELKRRRREN